MTENSKKEAKELLETLVARAQESVSFKEQLVSNPKGTIEEIKGATMNIPEGMSIVVEDQTDANTIYLNIPPRPELNDVELCEEELEQVSGGTSILGVECAVIAAVVGTVVAVAQIAEWVGEGVDNYYDEQNQN